MFKSIFDDIKEMLGHGNMPTKIILVNIFTFVLIGVFLRYLFPTLYVGLLDYLALSSDIWWNLKHPWVFVTHLFLHAGVYHILWNLLLYYWFGRIVGDLVGDDKILPLFIYGGLMGAIIYMISYYFISPESILAARAIGASASVMATVVAAGILAPDYKMNLILIGQVSIKWIVLGLLILDMVGTSGMNNTGGHFAHLGGAFFGWLFISNLKNGNDLAKPFNTLLKNLGSFFNFKKKKSPLSIKHRRKSLNTKTTTNKKDEKLQARVDEILDKINVKGYDQLSEEEKEFLFIASKKKK